uniref:SP110 nuclear antigen, tandem duplicate 1 n=1 Tax=Mastacembelus armatus TaxID=205130 RepID=A0A3Q3L352_9TELE
MCKNKKLNIFNFPDSPLKKGEKSDIWNWKLFKAQMPVTCGDIEAILSRDRLAKGEKCILFQKSWFTPTEFEKRAGKGSSKNWKTSIRCKGTTLGKLIQVLTLTYLCFNNDIPCVNRTLNMSATDEEEDKEQAEPQTEVGHDRSTTVFKVTCRDLVGTLHKKRFASGNRGKCIRTETSWMSPVEFVNAASDESDPPWKREIQWEGKPLNDLIENKILRIHSLLCENQKNDDECYICRSQEETQLVVCDDCPRSFHQRCHLPHLEDLTDYSTVIQTPMWLGHIANKLQENNYQTVEQFVSDVQLIFSNCARYNRVRNCPENPLTSEHQTLGFIFYVNIIVTGAVVLFCRIMLNSLPRETV